MVQEMNSTLDVFTLRVNGTSLRGFICKTVRYIQMQTYKGGSILFEREKG